VKSQKRIACQSSRRKENKIAGFPEVRKGEILKENGEKGETPKIGNWVHLSIERGPVAREGKEKTRQKDAATQMEGKKMGPLEKKNRQSKT